MVFMENCMSLTHACLVLSVDRERVYGVGVAEVTTSEKG